jgi:hypothetical protein
VFEIVVAITVESAFRLEIHQNNIFFLKFNLISSLQNDLKTYKKYFLAKKNFKI